MPRKTRTYNVAHAKAHLSSLVREALAGDEVIVAKDNKPLVAIVPLGSPTRRAPGSAKGRVIIADDFDAPLDDFSGYR